MKMAQVMEVRGVCFQGEAIMVKETVAYVARQFQYIENVKRWAEKVVGKSKITKEIEPVKSPCKLDS